LINKNGYPKCGRRKIRNAGETSIAPMIAMIQKMHKNNSFRPNTLQQKNSS
jgi:hypothetical protein